MDALMRVKKFSDYFYWIIPSWCKPLPVIVHCTIKPVRKNEGHAARIIQENQQGGGSTGFKETLCHIQEIIVSLSIK